MREVLHGRLTRATYVIQMNGHRIKKPETKLRWFKELKAAAEEQAAKAQAAIERIEGTPE